MNKDFIESLIKMNELEMRLKGYSKVKAIAFEGNVDYENDPVIRKMEADGWKVKDENLFGDGLDMVGTVVVFRERSLNGYPIEKSGK